MAEITVNGSKLSKEKLFPMFKKNIGGNFPESDGWKVYNRFNWVSYLHDFVLQRENGSRTERVVVEINTDKKITEDQLRQLDVVANRLTKKDTVVIKKILIINKEADLKSIPSDIEVYFLSDFLSGDVRKAKSSDSDKLVA